MSMAFYEFHLRIPMGLFENTPRSSNVLGQTSSSSPLCDWHTWMDISTMFVLFCFLQYCTKRIIVKIIGNQRPSVVDSKTFATRSPPHSVCKLCFPPYRCAVIPPSLLVVAKNEKRLQGFSCPPIQFIFMSSILWLLVLFWFILSCWFSWHHFIRATMSSMSHRVLCVRLSRFRLPHLLSVPTNATDFSLLLE